MFRSLCVNFLPSISLILYEVLRLQRCSVVQVYALLAPKYVVFVDEFPITETGKVGALLSRNMYCLYFLLVIFYLFHFLINLHKETC